MHSFLRCAAVGGALSAALCGKHVLFAREKAEAPVPSDAALSRRFAEPHGHSTDIDGRREQRRARFAATMRRVGAVADARAETFMRDHGVPGVGLAIAVDGAVVLHREYGLADIENKVPVTDRSLFRIASISKPITAAVLFHHFHSRGNVLSCPISTFVPAFPPRPFLVEEQRENAAEKDESQRERATEEKRKPSRTEGEKEGQKDKQLSEGKRDPTLLQLLSHRGGIRHYRNDKEFIAREKFVSAVDALRPFKDDPLKYEPGTKVEYTSFGFVLVMAAVEQLANGRQKFGDVMTGFISLLGLRRTRIDFDDEIIEGRAKGMLINAPFTDNSGKIGSGGLLSNASDLCRFGMTMLRQLDDGRWLPKKGLSEEHASSAQQREQRIRSILRRAWTPLKADGSDEAAQSMDDWKGQKYLFGLGWLLTPPRDIRPVYAQGQEAQKRMHAFHSGAGVGFSSFLLVVPSPEATEQIWSPTSEKGGGSEKKGEGDGKSNSYAASFAIPRENGGGSFFVRRPRNGGIVVAVLSNKENARCKEIAEALAEATERELFGYASLYPENGDSN